MKWISGSRFAWYPILEVDHPRSQSWSLLWWNCGIPGIIYTTRNLWWSTVKHNHSMNLYNHIKQLKMCVSIINYIHEAVANRYAQLRGGYLVPFLPFRNWGSRPQRVDRSSDQEHRTGQEPAKRWTQRLETGIEQTIGRESTRCEFSGGKVFDVFVTGWNLRFLRLDEFFVWRSKTICFKDSFGATRNSGVFLGKLGFWMEVLLCCTVASTRIRPFLLWESLVFWAKLLPFPTLRCEKEFMTSPTLDR